MDRIHGIGIKDLKSASAFIPTILSIRVNYSSAFEVEREEACEGLFVGERGRPAVRGGDGFVEPPVRVFEPGGALVVEVRERAAREFAGGGRVARDEARVAHDADAARVRARDVARPGAVRGAGEFERLFARPLGRVEPARAQRVQLARGPGDGL